MHRVLRRGGYLLLSFQSDYLMNRILAGDLEGYPRDPKSGKLLVAGTALNDQLLEKLCADYRRDDFGYYECYPESDERLGVDRKNFGMAFISPKYVERHWTRLFKVERLDPGATGMHDVILLRSL